MVPASLTAMTATPPTSLTGEPEVLWAPDAAARGSSRMGRYLEWLVATGGPDRTFGTYDDLWRWSVSDLDGFWSSIAAYFEVRFDTPPARAIGDTTMPGAAWFSGATLNYAEHALRLPGRADDDVVLVSRSQTRPTVELTAAGLRGAVAAAAAGLQRLGVGTGDRVVAYAPNIAETVVAMLATASLGAIWSSCAPEFGVRGVIDRVAQVEPTVLIAVDGYRYGSKAIDRRAEVAAIREALPSLRATVAIPYLGDADGRSVAIPGAIPWAELASADAEPLRFEPVPFDHPLAILYSSGTTGLPKAIVHGHGGILLEHLKALGLHTDLGPADRFTWFTTTGWMMWNYLVSGLLVGSTIVLVDGDPAWPDLGALWRLAAEERITYFGASAPFLMACRAADIRPAADLDLTALRGIGSTGAPLPPDGFRWVRDAVRPTIPVGSLSGGTDLCTGFVGPSPLVPVWIGEISCRMLGARVESHDAAGEPGIGRLGELVLAAPMPSMPVAVWGDADGSRYRSTWFADGSPVWRHGDWITITERGSCVITGRSDATLNRGGVRLGTAEFSACVEALPEVADSLVVHLEDAGGGPGELILFIVLRPGHDLDEPLRRRIAASLRAELSPRHVPDAIVAMRSVPRTLSGKKLEVPVKRILGGADPETALARSALADPASIDPYIEWARSRPRSRGEGPRGGRDAAHPGMDHAEDTT